MSTHPRKQLSLTPNTLNSIQNLMENWIGLDSLVSRSPIPTRQSFPPYDIIKQGTNYKIVMALAGYSIDDINITLVTDQLIVETKQDTQKQKPEDDVVFLYQGIAKRSFKQHFNISPDVKIKSAYMVDGMLTITAETQIPEAHLPKNIPILTFSPK